MLAVALQTALGEVVAGGLLCFQVSYDLNDNLTSIKLINHEDGLYVRLVPDADLIAGVHWVERLVQERIESLNGVLRVDKTITLTAREPTCRAYMDFHTTRDLYLTSSTLASYKTISKVGNDVIINNNPSEG